MVVKAELSRLGSSLMEIQLLFVSMVSLFQLNFSINNSLNFELTKYMEHSPLKNSARHIIIKPIIINIIKKVIDIIPFNCYPNLI